MNIGGARKYAIKRQIQMTGMAEGHGQHDEQLCNYADAAAEDMYQQIIKELPAFIDREMIKYLRENPYQLEVDKASLATVRQQITSLFKGLFK